MTSVNQQSKDGRAVSERPAIADERLVSELAHEFRTPLGVIMGYAELLRLRDDPKLRNEGLPRIEEAAKRLAGAIDDLLSLVESDSSGFAQRFLKLRTGPQRGQARSHLSGVGAGFRTSNAPRATRCILVVDDDEEIRELLLRTLPADGFKILEARDGREALELVAAGAPDLVLLDWNMPNVSGGDVLSELARRECGVPVIVLTAHDEPERRRYAESLGVDAFLAKPFSPLELLREIERLLA